MPERLEVAQCGARTPHVAAALEAQNRWRAAANAPRPTPSTRATAQSVERDRLLKNERAGWLLSGLRRGSRTDLGMIGLLASLLILPLYPKIGLVAVKGTYIPIRVDDVVTAVVAALWLATLLRERRRPRLPGFAPVVAVWLAVGLVALVIGVLILGAITISTGLLFWAKPIEYLLLGWVAFDLVDVQPRLVAVVVVALIAASGVLGYALLERFGWLAHAPNYAMDVQYATTLGSTMGDSHQLASYMGLATLLAVAVWTWAPRGIRAGLIVWLALAAYVLSHAAGRSEFLGLLLCSGALVAWRPARIPAVSVVVFLVVAFMLPQGFEDSLDAVLSHERPVAAIPSPGANGESPAPTAGGPVASPAPVTVSDRFGQIAGDLSLQIRLERWRTFVALAMRDPLFGAGPSAATEAADGYFIRSFTEVGIVGTFVFVLLIVSILLWLLRSAMTAILLAQTVAIGMVAGTVFLLIVGVLIDVWTSSRPMQLYWPMIGSTIGVAAAGVNVHGLRRIWPVTRWSVRA